MDADRERQIADDRPPFLRSWAGVYGVVLGWLALLVTLFHLLTRHYR